MLLDGHTSGLQEGLPAWYLDEALASEAGDPGPDLPCTDSPVALGEVLALSFLIHKVGLARPPSQVVLRTR